MENKNVVLSQDPERARQIAMAMEFVDDGAGYCITAQEIRKAVLNLQESQARETKRLEDNIITLLKVKDCVFPDGTMAYYEHYLSTPYLMARNYDDLKQIRRTLLKAKLKYSDSILSVAPVGWDDNADVVFSTNLGFSIRTRIPIKDFPQELLPSEECSFEKKARNYSPSVSWELSCPMQKS